MGNCGACNCNRAVPAETMMTKADRIEAFEESLPFQGLFIDEYESLLMAVAKVQKINHVYEPPLASRRCQLR